MTVDEFSAKEPSRESLSRLLRNKDDPTDRIFVFFPDEPKVGVKTIRAYVERMQDENVKRAILVVQDGITPFAKQGLAEMDPSKYYIEQFLESELLVNITQHQLVPRHVALTPQEKANLLERYKCKPTQLPRMQATDPVARYYGLKRGTVVKIIR
eukprot:CAMPEP_0168584780 /NCGR_PEP_ID=MMETSP0420-20121227/3328_1 /TAXON_ID=498008 /ORGANISM="Pessonella sp." /LENGTH=154 /DNA_ID=CAMNT_0008619617 /DNA_START=182 /DNA_END=642 /DNA_ORIENTATION=+